MKHRPSRIAPALGILALGICALTFLSYAKEGVVDGPNDEDMRLVATVREAITTVLNDHRTEIGVIAPSVYQHDSLGSGEATKLGPGHCRMGDWTVRIGGETGEAVYDVAFVRGKFVQHRIVRISFKVASGRVIVTDWKAYTEDGFIEE